MRHENMNILQTKNPNSEDCAKFFEDLNTCINKNVSHQRGELKPSYFDFTKCKEFEIFKEQHYLKSVTLLINTSELAYPYNRYYTFVNNNNTVKIVLSD